jgi:cell division protein FtsW
MAATYVFAQDTSVPEYDRSLAWTALLLMALGLVMVYSASIATAEASRFTGSNAAYFLMRHTVFLGAALAAALVVFLVPVRLWQKLAPLAFLASLALLVLVLVPGVGREVNGARRWLDLGAFTVQPSEFVKLATVLYAADYTVRKQAVLKSFRRGLLPMLGVMLFVSWLLLREPDFGALVVIAVVGFGVLFLGGMNGRHFAALVAMLALGFALLVLTSEYRMQRIFGFMDPWTDPFGRGYQLSHALIAFGRGEWLGVGLGASVEKLFYLPEAHTDFLLAVIAEELGFLGVAAVSAGRRPPGAPSSSRCRPRHGAGGRAPPSRHRARACVSSKLPTAPPSHPRAAGRAARQGCWRSPAPASCAPHRQSCRRRWP